MKKGLTVAFVFLFFVAFAHVYADQVIPVSIKGDYIYYDQKMIVIEGNVEVTYEDVKINASRLEMDNEEKVVTASGNVTLSKEEETLHGRSMTYWLKEKRGVLIDSYGKIKGVEFKGKPIKGEIFYQGKEMHYSPNIIEIIHSSFTTCDYPPEKKHYRITAQDITIYPEDKMIIKKASLWIGKKKLWTVNRYVVSLKKKEKKKQPWLPTVGYNEVDGWFIKALYNYYMNRKNYGSAIMDYYEKSGFAKGIDHNYALGEKGEGTLYLYHQNNPKTGVIRKQQRIYNRYNFGGGLTTLFNMNFSQYQVPPFSNPTTSNYQLGINKVSRNFNSNLNWNSSVTGSNKNNSFNLRHSHRFTRNLRMNLNLSFFRNQTTWSDIKRLHYVSNLLHQGKSFDTQVIFENTDSDTRAFFINKSPQIIFKSRNFKLKGLDLPYQVNLSLGRFFESAQELKADRVDVQLRVPGVNWKLGKAATLSGNFLYRQNFYFTGNYYYDRNFHARYVLNSQVNLVSKWGKHFDGRLNYRSQAFKGFNPFRFDNIGEFKNISAELSFYNQDYWRLNLGMAYDFKTEYYQNLITRLYLRPKENWQFHFDSTYNPNTGQWLNLVARADLWLRKDIRLQYWSAFNLRTNQPTYQDFSLYKDLHCWWAKLSYRWQTKEYFLEAGIKAFPYETVNIGFGEEGPMLDTHLFQK